MKRVFWSIQLMFDESEGWHLFQSVWEPVDSGDAPPYWVESLSVSPRRTAGIDGSEFTGTQCTLFIRRRAALRPFLPDNRQRIVRPMLDEQNALLTNSILVLHEGQWHSILRAHSAKEPLDFCTNARHYTSTYGIRNTEYRMTPWLAHMIEWHALFGPSLYSIEMCASDEIV